MALYLHCAICSRKRADGLLSGAAWGRLQLPPGTESGTAVIFRDSGIEHPALKGSMFRVCPTCMQRHPDWESSLLASFGLAPAAEAQ